jgi:dimethylhistidine N-methyltransferase
MGSRLFEEILKTEEYYIPRAEAEIYDTHNATFAQMLGPEVCLLEPGAGNCTKAEQIIRNWGNIAAYVPMEIAAQTLNQAAYPLALRFSKVQVCALATNYLQLENLPPATQPLPGRRVVFFPGSSLGNYSAPQALALLQRFRQWAGPQGALLIGVDTPSQPNRIHSAYNDPKGITAAFNLNVLSHLRQATGLLLPLHHFYHRAFYNASRSCVEMHLVVQSPFEVDWEGEHLVFRVGETIHTEDSFKYSPDAFRALALQAGYAAVQHWQDAEGLFAVYLCQ